MASGSFEGLWSNNAEEWNSPVVGRFYSGKIENKRLLGLP